MWIIISVFQSEKSSYHSSSSTCSLSSSGGSINESELCINSVDYSDAAAAVEPASHHRGKIIGANVNAADVSSACIKFADLV